MTDQQGEKRLATADDSSPSPSFDAVKRSVSGIKLEPQPSDDPNDPLNWGLSKKITMLAIISFAALVGLSQSLANQAGIVVQGEVYHKTPTQMAYSISAATAGLATGPFLWSALALRFGRTSVVFWTLICNIGINIWSASMTRPDQYVPFVVSRWLGGTFGSGGSTIGAGLVLDIFFLHQRGRAFACYTLCTLFGTQLGGTLSGYIADKTAWPVYFWWTVGALALAAILVFLFLEDTSYDRDATESGHAQQSYIGNRVATFFPGNRILKKRSTHRAIDPIMVGVQPPALLSGLFLTITFAWAVAVTTLLGVFLQTPVKFGGYGFTPLGNANVTFAQWIGIVVAELYGLAFNDRLPLWRCRRNGGVWRPEYRLYPLLGPAAILLPVALGIFGAALQYHLHYLVLAFAVVLLNVVESLLVPVIINYVCECFVPYAQEVTTALNFYRLILGLTVTFYIDPWIAAVGAGWTFGMMAFFALIGFGFTFLLSWKGPALRQASSSRYKVSEDGDMLFAKLQ